MIDFSTQQLTWLMIGATTIGGTGYMTMSQKVDQIDKNIVVTMAHEEDLVKNMDQFQKQLDRIESKIDSQGFTKHK